MKFLSNVDTLSLLQLPLGSPEGLTLSYVSPTQITVAPGRAVIGAAGNRSIAVLSGTLTKILTSVWAAGNGAGGRFSGAPAVGANQTWHKFLIRNATTGVADAGFDSSATGANIPSGWSGRIIGSAMTDGGGNIRSFLQIGDLFSWSTPIVDFSSSNATPTAATNLVTITVPQGIRVIATGYFVLQHPSATLSLYSGSPETAPMQSAVSSGSTFGGSSFRHPTNTAGQIRLYAEVAGAYCTATTQGFHHLRGT